MSTEPEQLRAVVTKAHSNLLDNVWKMREPETTVVEGQSIPFPVEEDMIEALFWHFDAQRNGMLRCDERLAFKEMVRLAVRTHVQAVVEINQAQIAGALL